MTTGSRCLIYTGVFIYFIFNILNIYLSDDSYIFMITSVLGFFIFYKNYSFTLKGNTDKMPYKHKGSDVARRYCWTLDLRLKSNIIQVLRRKRQKSQEGGWLEAKNSSP